MRAPLLLFVGLATWTTLGAAQARPSGPVSSSVFLGMPTPAWRSALEAEPDTVERQIKPTYWKEGALLGGILGALGGGALGRGLCGMSEQPNRNCTGSLVLGAVVGAALLAIPGALIGGQVPKGGGAERPPD